MLHGGVAANAPDLGALLTAGGLGRVSRWPSPIGVLHIVRGVRQHDVQDVGQTTG